MSNPADLPLHRLNTLELAVSQLWRQGPHWLHAHVPWTDPEPTCMPNKCAVEMKTTASHNLMSTNLQGSRDNPLSCERFSTQHPPTHVVRTVRRFRGSRNVPTILTPDALAHAEMLWIKSAQRWLRSQGDFKTQQKQLNLHVFADKRGV